MSLHTLGNDGGASTMREEQHSRPVDPSLVPSLLSSRQVTEILTIGNMLQTLPDLPLDPAGKSRAVLMLQHIRNRIDDVLGEIDI